MTSPHPDVHRITPIRPRPLRCLRHRVWMASCTDCGEAHAEILRSARESGAQPR